MAHKYHPGASPRNTVGGRNPAQCLDSPINTSKQKFPWFPSDAGLRPSTVSQARTPQPQPLQCTWVCLFSDIPTWLRLSSWFPLHPPNTGYQTSTSHPCSSENHRRPCNRFTKPCYLKAPQYSGQRRVVLLLVCETKYSYPWVTKPKSMVNAI